MDQSKSNSKDKEIKAEDYQAYIPKRKFTLEFFVGLFTLVSMLAAGYLAVGLGGLDLNSSNEYEIIAQFDDVAGLKKGASVEIAGVQIGSVNSIGLKDSMAEVKLRINKKYTIQDDDIAMIRTKGIIGDRYVKISPGASEVYLQAGDVLFETESVLDIEDLIGKVVHNFTSDDKDKTE